MTGLCQTENALACSAVIMVGTKAFLSLRTVLVCITMSQSSFFAISLHSPWETCDAVIYWKALLFIPVLKGGLQTGVWVLHPPRLLPHGQYTDSVCQTGRPNLFGVMRERQLSGNKAVL